MFAKLKRKITDTFKSITEPYPIEVKQCEKDNSQKCPSCVLVHVGGRLENSGFTSCCKFFDRMKQMNKNIARCEPNKDYNGTIYSKSVVESSRRSYEEIKHIEYIGPICEANKRILK